MQQIREGGIWGLPAVIACENVQKTTMFIWWDIFYLLLCINKFLEGGVENALYDASGRGRIAEITDGEKAWIINIACQKPVDLGYSAAKWTQTLLTKHINKYAEDAGHTRLSTISQSKVRTILEEAEIKPNKITYYCENRDLDFEKKMHNVLLVYKQLEMQFDEND